MSGRIDGKKLKTVLESFPGKMKKMLGKKILIVGDVGLDEYVFGDVRRISPEAPVPVLEVTGEDRRLGLASNVAQNVTSLGGIPILVGIVGADDNAELFRAELKKAGVSSDYLIVDLSRPTTKKVRIMAGQHHVVRIDHENKSPISIKVESELLSLVIKMLPGVDGVIIEDYAKGMLSESSVQEIIREAHELGKKVFVDPNMNTPANCYSNADVITPNKDEAAKLSCIAFRQFLDNDDFVIEIGRKLKDEMRLRNVVITRGKDGMTMIDGNDALHLPTFAKQVFDVTGAGDTAIAAMALANISGMPLADSCVFANVAAGVVVGKVGCVPCSSQELIDYARSLAEEVN